MKKIYSLILFAFAAFSLNAQVTVVFSVDMNDAILAEGDIVTIGGDFQSWTPGAEQLADNNGDGVYVITYELNAGQDILWKFVINDWGTNEFGDNMMTGECNDVEGNRFATIPADETGFYYLPTYVYDSCETSALSVDVADLTTISGVKFTPNPAFDRTLITFSNPTNAAHDIIVTSMTGQVVSTLNKVTGNNAALNVADFAKGMYFVTFRNEAGEQGTEKLIVK